MCYMRGGDNRVGIRQLRQNLSVYLRRVMRGERLEVTDRGRVVAMLVPVPPAASALERMVAAGRATPAAGSLADLPPLKGRPSTRVSEALEELRSDRL